MPKSKLVEPLRYTRREDVQMRLGGSVVRYKGEPVQCESTGSGDGLSVNLYTFDSIKRGEPPFTKVHSSDIELDIRSPRLGYGTYKKRAVYLSRRPERRQKQGLTTGCISVSAPSGLFSTREVGDLFFSDTLVNIIKGKYPTYDEALWTLQKGSSWRGMAFSYDLCLRKDDMDILKLDLRGDSIGWIPPKEKSLLVPETEKIHGSKRAALIEILKKEGVTIKDGE